MQHPAHRLRPRPGPFAGTAPTPLRAIPTVAPDGPPVRPAAGLQADGHLRWLQDLSAEAARPAANAAFSWLDVEADCLADELQQALATAAAPEHQARQLRKVLQSPYFPHLPPARQAEAATALARCLVRQSLASVQAPQHLRRRGVQHLMAIFGLLELAVDQERAAYARQALGPDATPSAARLRRLEQAHGLIQQFLQECAARTPAIASGRRSAEATGGADEPVAKRLRPRQGSGQGLSRR